MVDGVLLSKQGGVTLKIFESLISERVASAEEILAQTAPYIEIRVKRTYIKKGFFRLLKSVFGSFVFLILYWEETRECSEIFWKTVNEHHAGIGFDIAVFDKRTQKSLLQLPWYNVFMSKKKARDLAVHYADILGPIGEAFERVGIRISWDERERLQVHWCL